MLYESLFHDKARLSNEARILDKYRMRSAALFHMNKNESMMRRAARVTRCCFEEAVLPAYSGGRLYPTGGWTPAMNEDDPAGHGLKISFTGAYVFKEKEFTEFTVSVKDPFEQTILKRIASDASTCTFYPMTSRYRHGGGHWVMDHDGILKEGLSGYAGRTDKCLENARSPEERMFYEAMLDVVEGLSTLARRFADHLQGIYRQKPSDELERLIKAYERVSVLPAETFFEAVVCTQFFMGYASSSEPGHMDRYLLPFYERDLLEGRVTPGMAEPLLEELVQDTDRRVGSPGAWHMVLGGSDEAGNASYNALTRMLLIIMKRYRQPNTSLRVRHDMPEDIWDIVLDNLGAGCGNPAIINENAYLEGFRKDMDISDRDFAELAFGGCTETLFEGRTNSESIGSMLNLADVLEQSISARLLQAESFEEFYRGFKDDLKVSIREMHEQVNLKHTIFAAYCTDPVRTLLTRGCIENGKGFYQGGPVYNLENSSVYGTANVLNALYAIKAIYEGKPGISREKLLQILYADFAGYEYERAELMGVPKFGNSCREIDVMASDLIGFVFREMKNFRCMMGKWHITPSIIGWVTFVSAGKYVGSTPDGRKKGEALSDSTGPVQGTDREGPTQLLLSAAAIPQVEAVGTCVLNLMMDRILFQTETTRKDLISLFKTYLNMGGLQLQVNVLDRKILEAAVANPEKYGNLIVRVAGYNDYFTRQSRDIQQEIIKRTEHRIM